MVDPELENPEGAGRLGCRWPVPITTPAPREGLFRGRGLEGAVLGRPVAAGIGGLGDRTVARGAALLPRQGATVRRARLPGPRWADPTAGSGAAAVPAGKSAIEPAVKTLGS